MLNEDNCYQALLTHDTRFDGVFYVGVTSTKVYCRTVCTARTPRRTNCKFYRSAAAAECAGFRPCLRCRPELAPGNAVIDAVSNLAASVVDKIESGEFSSIQELAEDLGVSDRHLRRVVQSEFGVSPIELAQTHRLLLAKLLLTDSKLPITEIAFASGFSSLRQFNSKFKDSYNLRPSDLRRDKASSKTERAISCELAYRKPFAWKELVQFLSSRAIPNVELVSESAYMRTLSIGKHSGWVKVQPSTERETLTIELSSSLAAVLPAVLARIKHLFDLNADTPLIEKTLGKIARKHPGLRVPGCCDGFELAMRAILGQQISVKAASTLMERITEKFGSGISTGNSKLTKLSPGSAIISRLQTEDLTALGLTIARARTVIELAKAVETGKVSFAKGTNPDAQIAQFQEIPGIGEWTAQYIAMRALKWPDAFPHSDLGIKKALSETDNRKILKVAEQWKPWRSYAAMHLWFSLHD